MKSNIIESMFNVVRITTCIILIAILSVATQAAEEVVTLKAQTDTTPPVFLNLNFPFNGIVPEEGLLITGTLMDETAFHPMEPIVLEVDVLGQTGVLSTKTLTVRGGPYWEEYDTHFDDRACRF